MADEELLDLLLELQHDLGKYLRLPLTMLPADADEALFREALERALRQTRKGPDGVRPARDIWHEFLAELGGELRDSDALRALREAVSRALSWDGVLEDASEPIDRTTVVAELSAVGARIGDLIAEQRELADG
ncbi:MAG: hypothetical protein OXT09_02985 [Myxococcales bacterium]|nr:hypothetical protein [Myxococcales bacterium]